MTEKGYIKLARKSIQSDIWKKPPLFWKIWCYMLMRAYYEDTPGLKKGEFITTYEELQEAGSYYIGYRKVKPTKNEIRNVLNYLRSTREGTAKDTTKDTTKDTMAHTTKNTGGLLVHIDKYRLYQASETYEGHDEGHNEEHSEGHNERCTKDMTTTHLNKKKKKEEKELVNKQTKQDKKISLEPTLEEVKEEVSRLAYIVSPEVFFSTYEETGWTNPTDGEPIHNWRAVLKAWNDNAIRNRPAKRKVELPEYIQAAKEGIYNEGPKLTKEEAEALEAKAKRSKA